jgi:hypothetical protein
MWKGKNNAQKFPGLYVSEDKGNTWKLLCYFFQFKTLFVHPETGVLYAGVDYEWLEENKNGFLWPHCSNKILMSKDGKYWKDITGGNGRTGDIVSFIVDPDNPKLVCVQVCGIRLYTLQSEDDKYSEWNYYSAWDWPRRKEPKAVRQRNIPEMKGTTSLTDVIGAGNPGFATIVYFPKGRGVFRDNVAVYVNEYHTLSSLLELLSYFPAQGGTYKNWSQETPCWLICLHYTNKKTVVLPVYNYYLKSPVDGTFSPSIKDPKNTRLLKLLNEILESNKKQLVEYYQKDKAIKRLDGEK